MRSTTVAAAASSFLAACAMSTRLPMDGPSEDASRDTDGDADLDVDVDADVDADTDADADVGGPCPPGVEAPTEEVCGDGLDNDCDGAVDEGCPELPADCMCLPGSARWCSTSSRGRLGQQVCAADGWSWGRCSSARPPESCRDLDVFLSPELERCVVDAGGCTEDVFDLDLDGDREESVGACFGVDCLPRTRCWECDLGCTGCREGAWRYCDTPAYGSYGTQDCRAEGEWGPCLEAYVPEACLEEDPWYSPSAEACCIGAGLCCQDMWDLDGDGDTWESLGRCGPSC